MDERSRRERGRIARSGSGWHLDLKAGASTRAGLTGRTGKGHAVSKASIFEEWAESHGARAEVIQPEEGNGYTVFELAIANQPLIEVTVTE
jgi:hypothetical protein